MKKPVVIIGMGEIGGVFARGILKSGHPVYPIVRGMDIALSLQEIPSPDSIIVSVGEKDISSTLSEIPPGYHSHLVLVQNELLPKDWLAHYIKSLTVISVWFEKKIPNDFKEIIPSPVFGLKAKLIHDFLALLGIHCRILNSEEELLFELVLKNLYILTINIAGLAVGGGTVQELWEKHHELVHQTADEVLDIQFALAGRKLDRKKLLEGMLKAFEGDWQHKCMGRTSQSRLACAIAQADQAGLSVSKLRQIQSSLSKV
jgi:hypothetical protein